MPPVPKLVISFWPGQRVTTKRIGPPVVGEVRGVLLPFAREEVPEDLGGLIVQWDESYPNWREQPLVFVAVELSESEQAEMDAATHRLMVYPLADLEVL